MTFEDIYARNLANTQDFYQSIGRNLNDHMEDESFNLWMDSLTDFHSQSFFEKLPAIPTHSELESGTATDEMI